MHIERLGNRPIVLSISRPLLITKRCSIEQSIPEWPCAIVASTSKSTAIPSRLSHLSAVFLVNENAASASNDESNTNLDEHKLARARTACRKITSQPPDHASHSPQLHPQTVARIKAWNSALEAGHQAN
ncbi:hypothetical protein HDV62DRAFT_10562 [Trichoderma sp. SZMC 28011]